MEKSMKPKNRVSLPRYQQIAVEIAERVVEGRYQVGEKIHARSTLASNFNVSPETARKAINVLVDLEIMEVRHGSGAYVSSKENAQKFVEKYRNVQSVKEIQQEIADSIDRQRQELTNFSELLEALVNQTKQVHDISPFIPYELKITEQALHFRKKYCGTKYLASDWGNCCSNSNRDRVVIIPGTICQIKYWQCCLLCW